MLYKCLLGKAAGLVFLNTGNADTDSMSVKCWASVAGAGHYAFSPSQYFKLLVAAYWRYVHDALNKSWVNVGPASVKLAHI